MTNDIYRPYTEEYGENLIAQGKAIWEEHYDPNNIPSGVIWIAKRDENKKIEFHHLLFCKCWETDK